MAEHWKSSLVQHAWKHIWIHGFVIGVGVVLIGVLAWFFVTEPPWSATPNNVATAPPVQAPLAQAPPAGDKPASPPVASQPPVDPALELKSQLSQLLAGIKSANQKKDLPQLISYYSPNFPQLQQRTQQISKNWKSYDYPKMDFAITEVRLLADQTAVARVTWEVEAHHTGTLKYKNFSKAYVISFARESGQWRIKALDNAE
jgi:hypothetical protein